VAIGKRGRKRGRKRGKVRVMRLLMNKVLIEVGAVPPIPQRTRNGWGSLIAVFMGRINSEPPNPLITKKCQDPTIRNSQSSRNGPGADFLVNL
jgi:hypothetical protein